MVVRVCWLVTQPSGPFNPPSYCLPFCLLCHPPFRPFSRLECFLAALVLLPPSFPMNAVNRAMGITLLQCGHLRDIFPTMPKLLSYVNTKIDPEPFLGQERDSCGRIRKVQMAQWIWSRGWRVTNKTTWRGVERSTEVRVGKGGIKETCFLLPFPVFASPQPS